MCLIVTNKVFCNDLSQCQKNQAMQQTIAVKTISIRIKENIEFLGNILNRDLKFNKEISLFNFKFLITISIIAIFMAEQENNYLNPSFLPFFCYFNKDTYDSQISNPSNEHPSYYFLHGELMFYSIKCRICFRSQDLISPVVEIMIELYD